MNPVAALILWLVMWFMFLFIILPLRLKTQDESGEVTPGTPASAPINPNLKKKFILVTILTTVVWIPIVVIVVMKWITVADLDFFHRL